MKMSLKIVFALVCTAALCCAQNDSSSASSPTVVTPPAKEASAPANSAPANQGPAAPAPTSAPAQVTPPPAAQPSSQAAPTGDEPPTRKPSAAPQSPETAAAAPNASKAYVIGPLDVLIVRVWNNPNLSGAVDVRPDGMLSMQLIGDVKADGLTLTQLKETIRTRLSEFLNNPEVDVQLGKVNSKRYFVYGEVGHPGEFPLVEATTIMDALSNVGGFRDFANPKKIYVLRGTQKFNFNYRDVSKGKNMEQNIVLQNGDRIFVP
jgi:polysaccharide export outer membrane protein